MSSALSLSDYFIKIANDPMPLVPYNKEALHMLSKWCLDPTISPAGLFSAIALGGPQSSQGWASVKPGLFQFPQEHGPHWDIRNEWYYLACNLTYTVNAVKTPLYLLLAIIRRGTNPTNTTPSKAQIVACEFTLELPGTATPYVTQGAAFDSGVSTIIMQPPTATQGFQWSASDTTQSFQFSSAASATSDDILPLTVAVSFVHSTLGTVTCNLTLTSTTAPTYFLQGDMGCDPCLDGLGYRYYSWPALTVTKGTVTVGSTTPYDCVGQAWLDHQWGSRIQPEGYVDGLYLRALGILGNSYPKELAPQWDWFFMHLSNGMHITTVVLPSKGFYGDKTVPLTKTTFIVVDAANNLTTTTFQGGQVTYGGWVEVNCNIYASTWQLDWPDVSLQLTVTQSTNVSGFSKGIDGESFMEKGMTLTGTVNSVPVTGTGFAEAVGYDSTQKQIVELLSNILQPDQVQQYVPLFMPASASAGDIALASLIVIGPPLVLLIIIVTVAAVLAKKAKNKRFQRQL